MINYIIAAAIGMLFGAIFVMVIYKRKTTYGVLNIDSSNPEKDIYRLDFGEHLDDIPRVKRVVLEVNPNADLSQK